MYPMGDELFTKAVLGFLKNTRLNGHEGNQQQMNVVYVSPSLCLSFPILCLVLSLSLSSLLPFFIFPSSFFPFYCLYRIWWLGSTITRNLCRCQNLGRSGGVYGRRHKSQTFTQNVKYKRLQTKPRSILSHIFHISDHKWPVATTKKVHRAHNCLGVKRNFADSATSHDYT